jgi:hypothetical protein
MYFLGIFETFQREQVFFFAQVFALPSVLKLSFLLVVLAANFGDVVELFIVVYLFSFRESGRLFA